MYTSQQQLTVQVDSHIFDTSELRYARHLLNDTLYFDDKLMIILYGDSLRPLCIELSLRLNRKLDLRGLQTLENESWKAHRGVHQGLTLPL